MRNNIKKHHFIYKTTNLVNNKIYIGKHSTDDINDGYMGSGRLILKALNKYGKYKFKREILSYHNSSNDAFIEEANIVNDEFINRSDTYNLIVGGFGGSCPGILNGMYGRTHTDEVKKVMSDNMKGKVACVDKYGNKFHIHKTNERYINGEVIPMSRGLRRSKEFCENQSNRLLGSNNYSSKEVYIYENNILLKTFGTMNDASKYLDVSLYKIREYSKNGKLLKGFRVKMSKVKCKRDNNE